MCKKPHVPRGFEIPKGLEAVCSPTVSLAPVESRWDNLVHLAASVDLGHSSAISVLSRFGSAAKGDPIYEAGVQLGHLLRTVFLCDLFTKKVFQREIRHVLNHGESVNALKRAIYIGRVASYQARQEEEMQSVADALSLLANIVMAWNTVQMQKIFDGWNRDLQRPISKALLSRIAPTHIEGINLRGTFQFPIERFSAQLLPSSTARRSKRSSL
jgi:TnpA family transposase